MQSCICNNTSHVATVCSSATYVLHPCLFTAGEISLFFQKRHNGFKIILKSHTHFHTFMISRIVFKVFEEYIDFTEISWDMRGVPHWSATVTPIGRINKPRNDLCHLKANETFIWTFRNLIFLYIWSFTVRTIIHILWKFDNSEYFLSNFSERVPASVIIDVRN